MTLRAITGSIRFKFILLIGAILVVSTIAGTACVALNERHTLDSFLRDKGRSLGTYIANISRDPILLKDAIQLDAIVSEVNKDDDVVFAVIQDTNGTCLTTPTASFNTRIPAVKSVLGGLPSESDATVVLAAIKKAGLAVELSQPITVDAAQQGKVLLGVSDAKIRSQLLKTVTFVLVVNLCVALLVGSILSVASKKMILNPIVSVCEVTRRVAEGDLSQRVVGTSHDEFGVLATSINGMIGSLNTMVTQIQESSGKVAAAAEQIMSGTVQLTTAAHSQTAAAEQTTGTMEEMAAFIQTIADNADDLASSATEIASSMTVMGTRSGMVVANAEAMSSTVSETSATVEQMTLSIEKVAQNAEVLASSVSETSGTVEQMTVSFEQVAQNAQDLHLVVQDSSSVIERMATSIAEVARSVAAADDMAKQAVVNGKAGLRAGHDAARAMTRVADVIGNTSQVIGNLGRRSQEIGSIVEVISEIADQTNLLALNAAIEAARAGDAGRGFAVVADEVRKLAERSTVSTKEISQLIAMVQAETAESVRFGDIAAKEARDSMALTSVVGNSLESIVASIERASALMSQVSAMTSEQAEAASVVIQAVEQMSESTKAVAGAAREQTAGGRKIRAVVERMNEITREVTGATREQAQGSRQIRGAVVHMNTATGEVTDATREQASVAGEIAAAITRMNDMTRTVADATAEQKTSGEAVAAAMGNIALLSRGSLASAEDMNVLARSLASEADRLKALMQQFNGSETVASASLDHDAAIATL